MEALSLRAEGLTKRYGFRTIFKNIDFQLKSPASLVICGPNGSGKSTFLRLITGMEAPASGKIEFSAATGKIPADKTSDYIGYISPDMNFYHELTGIENLHFFMHVSGRSLPRKSYENALERVGLAGRGDDFMKEYSTGMRVRLKYALMLLINPPLLVLDEPTANLDIKGKEIIYNLMEEQKKEGILIFATNESDEIRRADKKIELAV